MACTFALGFVGQQAHAEFPRHSAGQLRLTPAPCSTQSLGAASLAGGHRLLPKIPTWLWLLGGSGMFLEFITSGNSNIDIEPVVAATLSLTRAPRGEREAARFGPRYWVRPETPPQDMVQALIDGHFVDGMTAAQLRHLAAHLQDSQRNVNIYPPLDSLPNSPTYSIREMNVWLKNQPTRVTGWVEPTQPSITLELITSSLWPDFQWYEAIDDPQDFAAPALNAPPRDALMKALNYWLFCSTELGFLFPKQLRITWATHLVEPILSWEAGVAVFRLPRVELPDDESKLYYQRFPDLYRLWRRLRDHAQANLDEPATPLRLAA